jgi:hypothetical protein
VTSLYGLGGAQSIATLAEILFLVVIVGALALFFIVAIGNRTDADPSGSRPMAAYLFAGAFLFLWATYFAVVGALNSLIQLLGSHPTYFGYGPSYTNAAIRSCVLGALIVVFGGGAYYLHLTRGNALADAEPDPNSPTKRVMRSYVALVSFISVIIFVLSAVVAAWLVCGLISPTIFLAGNRTTTMRSLLSALVLVIASGAIFAYHQRYAPSALRLIKSGSRGAHADSSTPSAPPLNEG